MFPINSKSFRHTILRRDERHAPRGPRVRNNFAVESLENRDCPTVTFIDFQETSPTDPLPLFGTNPTTVTPLSFILTPNGFQSSANPVIANDTTTSFLLFTIDADPGQSIDKIRFALSGDTTLIGNPLNSFASSGISANALIEITEINGNQTVTYSRSQQLIFNPNSGQFSLGQNGLLIGQTFDGTTELDVDDLLSDNGVVGQATKVKVTLTALLDTDSSAQGSSFIQLKAASIDVDSTNLPPILGTIGDTVFQDNDGSGTENAGDTPIAGVTVNLVGAGADNQFGTNDDTNFVDVTDANGNYLFENLPLGTYRVTVNTGSVPLFGLVNTADPDGVLDSTSLSTITANAPIDLTRDFGYRAVGAIGDTIFIDSNGDGDQDVGEPGVGNVKVTLRFAGPDGIFGNGDDVVQDTLTNGSGFYNFTNLPFGKYQVTVDTTSAGIAGLINTADPDGIKDSTSITEIGINNPVNLLQDFGYVAASALSQAVLSGVVYVDLNNNGLIEANEVGIPGVTVKLYKYNAQGGNDFVAQTTTDNSGFYSFTGLSAGAYRIIETQPVNYIDGKDTVGTLGSDNNDNDQFNAVIVPTNGVGVGYNFGEIRIATVSKLNFLANSSTLNFGNVQAGLLARFGAGNAPLVNAFLNPVLARQQGFNAGPFASAFGVGVPVQSQSSRTTNGGGAVGGGLALIDEAMEDFDPAADIADESIAELALEEAFDYSA